MTTPEGEHQKFLNKKKAEGNPSAISFSFEKY